MTRRSSAVHIPMPCAESWDAMTPTGPGRHCATCQKVVVDFSQKTDAEILTALRRAAGETCGRLRADQLGRPLAVPAPTPRWRAWLGAALALGSVLGTSRAVAQASQPYYGSGGPVPAAGTLSTAASTAPGQATSALPVTPETTAGGLVTLRGIVQDAATHEGLPGATVLVKGTNLGTSATATGAFELVVEASEAPVVLTFSYIGYVGQDSLVMPGSSQPLTIALATDVKGMMGEILMVGGVLQKPWPWHPRRLFNWGKYWLTKPFRG